MSPEVFSLLLLTLFGAHATVRGPHLDRGESEKIFQLCEKKKFVNVSMMEARLATLQATLRKHTAALSNDVLLDLLCNLGYDVAAANQKKANYNKAAATRFLQSSDPPLLLLERGAVGL